MLVECNDSADFLASAWMLYRVNHFCRPVASSENVTVILRLLIVAHGVMSLGSASSISFCSAEAYTNCFATTMRHCRTLR